MSQTLNLPIWFSPSSTGLAGTGISRAIPWGLTWIDRKKGNNQETIKYCEEWEICLWIGRMREYHKEREKLVCTGTRTISQWLNYRYGPAETCPVSFYCHEDVLFHELKCAPECGGQRSKSDTVAFDLALSHLLLLMKNAVRKSHYWSENKQSFAQPSWSQAML